MALMLYNTAAKRKEAFVPLERGNVGLYVCGVTVYDLCHIGHARSAIVFDVLVRYLRAIGNHVTYVRNFTDVDDKIIARAREEGKSPDDLAQFYIDAFYKDMDQLNILRADKEPRATEHIEGMIDMILTLIKGGHAYRAEDDVYFSVESFPGYGSLSGRRLEDMKAGSRIAVGENKRHPMDFALWKAAKEGEPYWDSPWGKGRPGWHMECSVMSSHFLGSTFDIHGGGEDLLFPHHENERAQAIAANGGDFARYWIHNGFVTVDSEKMSKSLGNFLTIRDALTLYHPQVLRLFLLSQHYRSPLDFTRGAVEGHQAGLVRIYRALERMESVIGPWIDNKDQGADGKGGAIALPDEFRAAMDDDLNTARAVAFLFETLKEINRLISPDSADSSGDLSELVRRRKELMRSASVLGLLNDSPAEFFSGIKQGEEGIEREEIERLIADRSAARAGKNWKKADEIRDTLKSMGVVLEDGPKGTTWRIDV
ncbi:MAG: cysteine--tRNA ligase [Desulfobacteraceae bacterium]|nr:MAG: cysteine--tRNA ligase [Desulfobacteraceae bacterium]